MMPQLAAESVSAGLLESTENSKVVRLWGRIEEDAFSVLQRRFADWINLIGKSGELFKEHVYDNPNMNFMDVRQHRCGLYHLLCTGEELGIDFIFLKAKKHPKQDEIDNFVFLTDKKLDELRQTLHEWHGNLDDQADIPDDFKQGIRDIQQGRVVDLDTALNTAPHGVKV